MKPFAHIFIVISWRRGGKSCALWLEREPDIESALLCFKNRFPSYLRPYASIPVYSEASWVWDIYVDFIKRVSGEFDGGIRFNAEDPETLYLRLFKGSIDECAITESNKSNSPKCYLTNYAVVVSAIRAGVEYVSVFDWFDDFIDDVKEHVCQFFVGNTVRICAVFESTPPAFLSILKTSSMVRALPDIPISGIRFVEMTIRTALREGVNQWTEFNAGDITAAQYRIYCDYGEDDEVDTGRFGKTVL